MIIASWVSHSRGVHTKSKHRYGRTTQVSVSRYNMQSQNYAGILAHSSRYTTYCTRFRFSLLLFTWGSEGITCALKLNHRIFALWWETPAYLQSVTMKLTAIYGVWFLQLTVSSCTGQSKLKYVAIILWLGHMYIYMHSTCSGNNTCRHGDRESGFNR